MSEETTSAEIAHGLEEIYQKFTDAVKDLGSKHGGKGKLGTSVLHWIAGSHVKTQRDVLCEQFLNDVKAQLELLDASLADADEKERQQAYAAAADVMTVSVPADSNNTTDLMKRAMIGQLKPYLKDMAQEDLIRTGQKIEAAYSKRQRLPVEQDILKAIDALVK